jgi:hypothetical protein
MLGTKKFFDDGQTVNRFTYRGKLGIFLVIVPQRINWRLALGIGVAPVFARGTAHTLPAVFVCATVAVVLWKLYSPSYNLPTRFLLGP